MLRFARVQRETPDRPSHFREDPNERTNMGRVPLDYPDDGAPPDKPEDYGFDESDTEPSIPVHFTEPPPSEDVLRSVTMATFEIGSGEAQQIASADRYRTRCVVRNTSDTLSACIVASRTDQNFMSFQLEPLAEVEFLHNAAMFARGLTDALTITVFSEYLVQELSDLER